jgi:phosphoglycolate phosphatase
MPKIKLIIFDLDGTLINAYPAIIKSFNYTMRRLHYLTQSPSLIRRAVGWGDENLLKPFVEKKDLARALSIYRRHHRVALLVGSRLFPQVSALLAYLRRGGYKLAVASNRPTRFSWILLRHLEIAAYFGYVLCADRLKHGKPHPEILKKIIHKFSFKSSQALYIGDMAIDAQAARRAKVKAIIVVSGSSTISEIKKGKPYKIIRKLPELLTVLKDPGLSG